MFYLLVLIIWIYMINIINKNVLTQSCHVFISFNIFYMSCFILKPFYMYNLKFVMNAICDGIVCIIILMTIKLSLKLSVVS